MTCLVTMSIDYTAKIFLHLNHDTERCVTEMVSLGDTAISLHILLQLPLGGGVFWVRSDLESRKNISFQFWGEGVFWVRSDLESRKKIRVFNFRGGWGVFWVRSDLDSGNNFIFGGGGGGVLGKVRFGI